MSLVRNRHKNQQQLQLQLELLLRIERVGSARQRLRVGSRGFIVRWKGRIWKVCRDVQEERLSDLEGIWSAPDVCLGLSTQHRQSGVSNVQSIPTQGFYVVIRLSLAAAAAAAAAAAVAAAATAIHSPAIAVLGPKFRMSQ